MERLVFKDLVIRFSHGLIVKWFLTILVGIKGDYSARVKEKISSMGLRVKKN